MVQAWLTLVEPSQAQHVVMVAHSYGGVCTAALLAQQIPSVTARLRGVALTDSVHGRRAEVRPCFACCTAGGSSIHHAYPAALAACGARVLHTELHQLGNQLRPVGHARARRHELAAMGATRRRD